MCRGRRSCLPEASHESARWATARSPQVLKLEDRGVAAVVMHSLFEEQIMHDELAMAEVHEFAQLLRRRRQMLGANETIDSLAGRQVMADRADAAQALHDNRHVPVRAALNELFETAELDDVQSRFANDVVVIRE